MASSAFFRTAMTMAPTVSPGCRAGEAAADLAAETNRADVANPMGVP
jgi:hypothetical protein